MLFCNNDNLYAFQVPAKYTPKFKNWILEKCFSSLVTHPRRPRGSQSGQERRQRKFSRTGERAPGCRVSPDHFQTALEKAATQLKGISKQIPTYRPVVTQGRHGCIPMSSELNHFCNFT